MIQPLSISKTTNTAQITPISADEAYHLMQTEIERLLALVDTLGPDDWHKPTICTEWNVRDMLAHQAGGFASAASYTELIRQFTQRPKDGQLPEDAVNAFQLRERTGKSPQELIAEIRRLGPIAAKNWAYRFRLLKLFAIPHDVAGKLSLRHLMWVIHSRDTWMHRLDICRATGREFIQTQKHDSRIVELVLQDVARCLERKYHGPSLVFELTGINGGVWQVGQGDAAAVIRMDALDFNIFASGRSTYAQARAQAEIRGDTASAEAAMRQILVVY